LAILQHENLCFTFVMNRRMEDRIRELCNKAVATNDSAELDKIIPQLMHLLHLQVEVLRYRIANFVSIPERRS
jgi:hypothetical protein